MSSKGPGPGRRRGRGHGRGRGRVGRGDVRIAVLALLAEEPMHGYQIMSELGDRTHGVWQPSPGSIYPLLQQLADEGLVTSNQEHGRRVFDLTDEGRDTAEASGGDVPVWDRLNDSSGAIDLRESIAGVASATRQVGITGTTEQRTKAVEILADARRRLYELLAEAP